MVDHVRESDIASAKEYLQTLIDPVELALPMAEPDEEVLSDGPPGKLPNVPTIRP